MGSLFFLNSSNFKKLKIKLEIQQTTIFLLFNLSLIFSIHANANAVAKAELNSAKSKSYKIVIIGDSITEGYGVEKEKAYPYLLEKKLNSFKKPTIFKVINNGISGSTTAGAKQRAQWAFKNGVPEMVILALGANDGLRGLLPSVSEKNLAEAIQWIQSQKVKVILFGMDMPPNYGGKYRKEFTQIFTHLEQKYKIALMPLFIKSVAGQSNLNQADGIHPNENGHELIAADVFRFLEKIL